MTAFDADNVFTRVEAGLWAVLEADTLFTDTIPEANRIKYHVDGARPTPDLLVRQASDHPWFRIWPAASAQNLERSSSTVTIKKIYAAQCSFGDMRTHAGINILEYAVLKAFERTVGSVELTNVSEVVQVQLRSTDYGRSQVESNTPGDQEGWFAIWQIEVDLKFQRSTLIA